MMASKKSLQIAGKTNLAASKAVTLIKTSDKSNLAALKSNQKFDNKFIQTAEKSDIVSYKLLQNNKELLKKHKSSYIVASAAEIVSEQPIATTNSSMKCTRRSSYTKNFRRHIQQLGKIFRCKLCSKSKKFSKISDVKEHIEFEHFKLGYHLCNECDRIFQSESRLEKHYKQRHNMERPLKLKTIVSKKTGSKRTKQTPDQSQNSNDVAPEENLDLQQENIISNTNEPKNQKLISNSPLECSSQSQNNKKAANSARPLQQQNVISKNSTAMLQNNLSRSILKVRVKQLSLDAWLKPSQKAEQQTNTNQEEKVLRTTVKIAKNPRSPSRIEAIRSQSSLVKRKRKTDNPQTNATTNKNATNQINPKSSQSNAAENQKAIAKPSFKYNKFSFENKYRKIGNFYYCTLCSRKYKGQTALRSHIKIDHYGYRYFCSYCDIQYTNNSAVRNHYKRVHNKDNGPHIFKKPKPEELQQPKRLNFDNIRKQNDDYYICSQCPAANALKTKCKRVIREHIKIYHYGYRYCCTECDTNYATSSTLKVHYKKQHNMPDGIVKCQKPNATMTIASSAKTYRPPKHYNYTNKYKKVNNYYICTVCPNSKKKFSTPNHIQKHIKFDHYGYRYICKKCNMSWCTMSRIKAHNIKVHNAEQPIIFARTKITKQKK